jgi:predicted permease
MQDLRLAVRALLAAPGVTLIAIVSLALGIGANTAIFSIVDALLLRPLPVRDPGRLVHLSTSASVTFQPNFSYSTFDQIRRSNLFDSALAFSNCCGTSLLTIGTASQAVERRFLSGDYFSTLGVTAAIGRMFTPEDDRPQGGPDGTAAVISYRLWKRQFNGAMNVIGSHVMLDRAPLTIVGVMPQGFFGTEVGRHFDLALPVAREPVVLASIPFDEHIPWLNLMFRLKPGQSVAAATEALRSFQPYIRSVERPDESRGEVLQAPFTLERTPGGLSPLRDRFERPLVIMFIVVTLVVVLAAANIASLQLARGVARRHQMGVRLALGASRWRLVRPLVFESTLLAAAGGIAGVVFAPSAGRAIVAQLSTQVEPMALSVTTDWRLVAFSGAVMIATTLLFGVWPAIWVSRVPAIESLKRENRGTVGERNHIQGALLAAQVALSLTLVVAAGVFVRSFERLARVPLGFDPKRVVEITVTAPTVPAERRNRFYHQLASAAARVPGVARAGGSMNPPLTGTLGADLVPSLAGVKPPPGAEPVRQGDSITPGMLAAYGIPIVAGRDLDERDTLGTQRVMLVNVALAQRLFPGRNLVGTPLDLTFRAGQDVQLGTFTVVGIVADSVFRSIRRPAEPTLYLPMAQENEPILQTRFYLAVRSATPDAGSLTRTVHAALLEENPDLQLRVRSLSESVAESLAQDRLVAILATYFGGLGLWLAGLGLYGVAGHAAARRRAEIGIRIALGARPTDVVSLMVRQILLMVVIGLAIGTTISLWASAFAAPLVYGIPPRDPMTLAASAAILVVVAAVAAGVPAVRAIRLDPAAALRHE